MQRGMAVLIVAMSACLSAAAGQSDGAFEIRRGTNISHWLSQSTRRGEARREWFTEKDVERIASLGFDHIRLPIDEEQMWDEAGHKEAEAFELLHNAIGWAQKNRLRVVVDLHILRSHHFNADEKPLWTQPQAQEKFFQLWRELSAELKKYPISVVAYELMNEPVADDPEDWNRVAMTAYSAIRGREPERMIVVGSNWFNQHQTFLKLRVPEDDDTILTFHYYLPMFVTHYTASWWAVGGAYRGPIHYPGAPIAEEDLRLRGAGEMLGTQQSGLPVFRIADLAIHGDLLAAARDDAALILQKNPKLTGPRGEALRVLLYLFERDEAVRLVTSG